MLPIGRLLIIAGIILLVLGLIVTYSNLFSFLKLGRLPGDISIRRENFSLHFPITTCILISVLITLILYIFRR